MRKITGVVWGVMMALLFLAGNHSTAAAEIKEIRIARQYGITYLQLMIMEKNKLIEKHARAAGLGDVEVKWTTLTGGADVNEALLSKSLDVTGGGVGALIKIWARTKGNLDVKSMGSLNSMPSYLVTINPKVKSVADFTEKDRIALPAVRVSTQAMFLEIEAAKIWGEKQYARLDHLTVTMSHPDATVALLSKKAGITAHVSSPPFQYQELEDPGVHLVLSSYDILGEPHSYGIVYTTSEFYRDNPKTYAAIVAALEEATNFINHNKSAAAQIYVEMAKSKTPVEKVQKMIEDPLMKFTLTPVSMKKMADFMYKVGAIKAKPDSWKDMFFPNVHSLPGS